MEATPKTRRDWVTAGFQILQERGVNGVKAVHVANRLGVTTGSFYWHFKDLQDLLDSLLEHWEHELTDNIIIEARSFQGPASERILDLMLRVISEDAAALDQPISVWSRSNPAVREAYHRTLKKRFEFAGWLFHEAGFATSEAKCRGRLMVTYLMGECSTDLKENRNWTKVVYDEFELIMGARNNNRHGQDEITSANH